MLGSVLGSDQKILNFKEILNIMNINLNWDITNNTN